ncbi:MAG: glycosyltransferase [Actinomycetota bacterium]
MSTGDVIEAARESAVDRQRELTVIVPAFQARATIVEAVASAAAQTAPPVEIVVVDDGSTDDTADIVRQHHPEVRVVTIPHAGEAAARNAGLRAATTDWVAFLDADDRFLPGRLAAVGAAIDADPGVDAVTTDAFMEVGGEIRGLCYGPDYRFVPTGQAVEILRRNFVFGHVVVRRQVLLDLGGFDESVSHGADWAMWLELLLAGGRITFVDRPLSVYVVHPGSASADRVAMLQGSIEFLTRAGRRPDLPRGGAAVVAESLDALGRDLDRARLGAAVRTGDDVGQAARAILDAGGHTTTTRLRATLAARLPGLTRFATRARRRGRVVATAGWLIEPVDRPARPSAAIAGGPVPLVSVILPFLDERRFLADAVDTVLGQTLGSFELLLVDDGSTDGSGDLADELAAKDPDRILVLRHPGGGNEGLAASRNLGLAAARGGAIAFLDADDRWEPDKLERQLRYLAESPTAGMVAGPTRHRFVDGDRPDEIHPIEPFEPGLLPTGRFARALVREHIPVPPPPSSVLYRATVLAEAGGVPAGNSTYEDQRTFVAVGLVVPTLITGEVLTTYARRPDSIYGRLGGDNVVKSQQRRAFEWWVLRHCRRQLLRRPAAVTVAAALVTHRLRVALGRRLTGRRPTGRPSADGSSPSGSPAPGPGSHAPSPPNSPQPSEDLHAS